MSTVTGTANFAQEKFPEATREYVPMLIGGVNIVAGIITTVQQFLKIGELNEAHRIASLSWDKFYRKIRIEPQVVANLRCFSCIGDSLWLGQ